MAEFIACNNNKASFDTKVIINNVFRVDLSFFTTVIMKTNLGAIADVPISLVEILQNNKINSTSVKKIRNKLISFELISAIPQKSDRQTEVWLYSINPEKLKTLFFDDSDEKTSSIHLSLVKDC